MDTLKELHDATLSKIELDWAKGTLVASFNLAGQRKMIISGEGIKSLSYNRKFPWGQSVSVNKYQIDLKNNEAVLAIEMQSGDIIIGKADSFSSL